MIKSVFHSCMLAMTIVPCTAGHAAAQAITAPAPAPVETPLPATAVCMVKTSSGGALAGQVVSIAVPGDKAADFSSRGFVAAPCGVHTQTDKSSVCAMADAHDPKVDASFWLLFSYTPAEACGLVEPVAVAAATTAATTTTP